MFGFLSTHMYRVFLPPSAHASMEKFLGLFALFFKESKNLSVDFSESHHIGTFGKDSFHFTFWAEYTLMFPLFLTKVDRLRVFSPQMYVFVSVDLLQSYESRFKQWFWGKNNVLRHSNVDASVCRHFKHYYTGHWTSTTTGRWLLVECPLVCSWTRQWGESEWLIWKRKISSKRFQVCAYRCFVLSKESFHHVRMHICSLFSGENVPDTSLLASWKTRTKPLHCWSVPSLFT